MKNFLTRERICPKCKMVFPCMIENCWCNELPPVMPLSGTGTEECLCPECLKNVIDHKIKTD